MGLVDLLRPIQFRGKARAIGWLAPQSGEKQCRVFDATMRLDLSDWIQRNVYLGTYERRETSLVRGILRPGDVAIDVGANIGYYTALFANLVGPTGRVIAAEPSPYAFEKLSKMISRSKLAQAHTINVGLGDSDAELLLYMDESAHNHSPTMVAHDAHVYAKVPVRKLDDVLDELDVKQVALLKMDVEGFEPRVLAGARRLLENRRCRAILIEFNEHWLRAGGSSPQLLRQMLDNFGFRDSTLNHRASETRLMTLADAR